MPGLISHIVIALSILNGPLADKNKQEFLVGTCFPDIRYLAEIDRKKTHNFSATLKSIQTEPSSFKAGMDFHNVVDMVWFDYIEKHSVLKMLPQNSHAHKYLKLFADTLLYRQIKNWQPIAQLFDTVWDQEKILNIPDHTIKGWHEFIQFFCETPQPEIKEILFLYLMIKIKSKFFTVPFLIRRFIQDILNKISVLLFAKTERFMENLQQNEQLKQILLYFYDNFEAILTQYEQEHTPITVLALP